MFRFYTSLFGLMLIFSIAVLPTLANAAEPTACAFGLLQCDESGVVWGLDTVAGTDMTAQLSSSDGLAEFILKFGYFLRGVIMPLLIALGLFFFLYNLARYFIIDVGNEDSREKAKQNTFWGLAAFILITSLWGIVNILTPPQIDRDRSICPDYLASFCGNLGYDGVSGGYTGGSNLDFGNDSSWTPDGGGSGIESSSGGNGASNSQLGELLFGNQAEQTTFNFRTGAARAQANTVGVLENASCEAGFTTLQLAAEVENSIGAYMLARTNGQIKWTNITDANGPYSIQYDADTVNNKRISGDTDITLVQFHPQATPVSAGLALSGYAPSPEDLEAVCSGVGGVPEYVIVDEEQLWVINGSNATCPRRASAEDDLITISTLLQIALMAPETRNTQMQLLYNWNDVPSKVRGEIRDYVSTDFGALSSNQIIAMADDLARQGNMSITRSTPATYCATY